jgi:MbtH protein
MLENPMSSEESEGTGIYQVVINEQGQYSIWPAGRVPPPGWKTEVKSGPKAECLAYIEEVWTDMRPLNVRK